jgi:hypothetical protein
LHERAEAALPLRIVFVERHEHADAPHAVALLRARAANGHVAAPPRNVMNARRRIIRSTAAGTRRCAQAHYVSFWH